MTEKRFGRRGRPVRGTRFAPRTFTFDDQANTRLDTMADADGKEYSEFVRDLVNGEWDRRNLEAISQACADLDAEYPKQAA